MKKDSPVIPSSPDPRDKKPKVGFIRRHFSPKVFDAAKGFTTIKNQGSDSSCTGFALCAWLEVLSKNKDLSERMAYETAKRYDFWKGENYDGSSLKGVLKGANKEGVCQEQFWKYDPRKKGKQSKAATASAKECTVGTYAKLMDRKGKPQLKEMFKKLSEGYGVIASIYVATGFERLNRANHVLRRFTGRKVSGHAITIVGYDKKKKLIKIRNSWGRHWGLNGYGFVDFKVFKEMCFDLWCFDSDKSLKTK